MPSGWEVALQAARRRTPPSIPIFDAATEQLGGALEVVIYNASQRVRGPFVEVNPEAVARALSVTAYGAFLVAQQAARRMLPNGKGAILFTGASAGVKGYPQSAAFAMGQVCAAWPCPERGA